MTAPFDDVAWLRARIAEADATIAEIRGQVKTMMQVHDEVERNRDELQRDVEWERDQRQVVMQERDQARAALDQLRDEVDRLRRIGRIK